MTFNRDNGIRFTWFLAGLGFGVLAGIFYAPRSGDETREAMRQSFEETSGYVKDRGREMQDKVSGWVDQGKEIVSRTKGVVSRAADQASESFSSSAGNRDESVG